MQFEGYLPYFKTCHFCIIYFYSWKLCVVQYLQILSIMGEEAMSAQVVLYSVDKQDEALAEKVDMSIQASMACLRIVFLNWFVSNLLVSDMFIVRFS